MMRICLILLMLLPSLARAALPFATAVVELRPVEGGYAAEAVVEAGRQSTIAAQVAGRILELKWDAGDAVKQGQLLARIDDSESRPNVAGNQAQVAQAQAHLVNAQAQYERTRKLVEKKFVSQSALDQARAGYEAAQAQLAAAKAGVAQAAATRSFSSITAPFSGVVSARHAQAGEMASLGRELLTVFDPATLRVVASIPQNRLEEIRRGGRASIEFPALGRWVEATSITVLPEADSRTHVFRVRLELPKEVGGIYPGMFARAHFATGQSASKLLIPLAAVVRRSELTGVYVVDAQSRVQLRQVRLGEASGDRVEVLSGLREGERIALEPVKAGIFLKQKR
ncbi:MAG: efflux RND transporter periplasmic adaptor subunit [Methylophilaceae bacterium]|nr:efflux RND transporter periplasmic adaptor subunit [Methylophilaceae bacterium]